MGKRTAVKPEPRPQPPSSPGPIAGVSVSPSAPTAPGRPWPAWACWVVSAFLLFHITAMLSCEIAGLVRVARVFGGQVSDPPLVTEIRSRFFWYVMLIQQETAHAFFAPEPDPATTVVTARLRFSGGRADREVRLPDPATRPRILYLRQIAMAWHLLDEWSEKSPVPRSFWAASYARHLCRTNPGCTDVSLYVQSHQMPVPASVTKALIEGKEPFLDAPSMFSPKQFIGAFSCEEFSAR